jgi:hypothetical protein
MAPGVCGKELQAGEKRFRASPSLLHSYKPLEADRKPLPTDRHRARRIDVPQAIGAGRELVVPRLGYVSVFRDHLMRLVIPLCPISSAIFPGNFVFMSSLAPWGCGNGLNARTGFAHSA